MVLVTQKEYDDMMEKTRKWAKNHSMFSSATTTAALAAAEFYFNQENKTIYKYLADNENV